MNPKDLVGAKKAALGVVPPALLIGTAPAMAVGANKYGPFNWRAQPVQVMTYVEAAMRHLLAFMDGQDNAEDTGVAHIAHAAASMGILMDAIAMKNVIDNRPSAGAAPILLREQDHSAIPMPPDDHPPHKHRRVIYGRECIDCGKPLTTVEAADIRPESETHSVEVSRLAQAANGGEPVFEKSVTIGYRGDYPPDTRWGGLLTCCGSSEHTLDCPQYR